MSTECPTCGRDDFTSEQYMRSHHAQAHGESIAGFEFTCEWCGKEGVKQQIDDRDDHQFCSKDCYQEWRSENLTGEDSPMWEGRTVAVECDWCGEDTEKAKVRLEENEHAFCSRDCHGEWISANQSGQDNPQWVGRDVAVECEQCGTEFDRDPNKVERNEHQFCSKDCYSEWMEENLRGPDHPRWVEDSNHLNYGGSWPRKRRQRLEKDDYTCVICGKSEEPTEDGRASLEVHHIVKARKFTREDGTLEEARAHRLENLVTLCTNCHRQWEGIPVVPNATPYQ